MPKILKFLEQGQKQERIPITMTFQSHAFGKSGGNNASLWIFHFQGESNPGDKDLCITGITQVLLAYVAGPRIVNFQYFLFLEFLHFLGKSNPGDKDLCNTGSTPLA